MCEGEGTRGPGVAACRGNCWYFTGVWVVMSEFDIFAPSPNDGITRATDTRLVAKRASVCGYGEDCASALNGSGGRVLFAAGML